MEKLTNKTIIKSFSFDQSEIIKNILLLHVKTGLIDLDPTYSKGIFYRNTGVPDPVFKFDLYPQVEGVKKANACCLPLDIKNLNTVMFDPPFIVGHSNKKPTGIIGNRFFSFRTIPDLWTWYNLCLLEFNRVLNVGGILIFKCQDTVSSGKQHFSHVEIINFARNRGFTVKDFFILLAASRIIGHNHSNQKHARKFHSYFIVFQKLEDCEIPFFMKDRHDFNHDSKTYLNK